MIKLICDTMSDVPSEIIEKYNIHVVPTMVTIDGKDYVDGVDITEEEFYKVLRSSKELPKTSQATYAQFKEVFDQYINDYDEILFIGGSSKASGTYQSAVLASKDCEGKATIHTFDTMNFSAGGAVFIIKACLLLDEGKSSSEIVNILESLKGTQKVFVSVDTLEYLKKGGRISTAKATLGTLLNLKPILELEDGLIAAKGQVRGTKQMINSIISNALDGNNDFSDKIVVYGCGDNLKDGETLKNIILSKNPKIAYEVKAGVSITAHSGPAIVGIACL